MCAYQGVCKFSTWNYATGSSCDTELEIRSDRPYNPPMSDPARPLLDDDEAETAALSEVVAEARADRRVVPHAEMRAWLLEIVAGNFDAPPPEFRLTAQTQQRD